MTRDDVEVRVKEIFVDVLGVDDEEVTDNAKLFEDLGAESIDLLDVQFRLEKEFDIKIPKEELTQTNILQNPGYVENGRLNDAGLKALKDAMPHADFEEFEQEPTVENVPDLLTVKMIINYVMRKLDAKGA